MNALTNITSEFEGGQLSTILYRGKPAWIAREVGRVLGYSEDGTRLARIVLSEWADEFIEGHDYVKLRGRELKEFKAVAQLPPESVGSRAPHLILLFESGLHMALAKTAKTHRYQTASFPR